MRLSARIELLGCFLIAFGLKLAILASAASPVPFADEWDGEAALPLKPFVDGTLRLADLFHPHNEHIMPFTRLLTLLCFKIAGYWDVVLQMIVNAAIHSAAIVCIAYWLAKPLNARMRPIFWLCAVLIASIPYGYENLLLGFNTHFYLLIFFAFAAFVCLTRAAAWSPLWWLGTGFAIASFFNMASGALTLPVAICVALLQFLRGQRAGPREISGIIAHGVVTIVLLLAIPRIGDPDGARSLAQFINAALTLLSWPTRPPFGLVLYVPSAILFVAVLRSAPKLDDGRWFIIAALGFVAAQVCAIAIGRANGILLSSRYFDALQLGMIANLASALTVLSVRWADWRVARFAQVSVAAWAVFLVLGLALSARSLPNQIDARRAMAVTEQHNLSGYVATGDFAYLANKSTEAISYPWPERLRSLLDDPTIRKILPPTLRSQEPPANFATGMKTFLFDLRYWLIGLGILAWLVAFAAARLRCTAKTAEVTSPG